jgi:hypothetical protein
MALFTEHATDLSDVYFQIQNYNYEAKRVRDAVEDEILHPRYRTMDNNSQVLESPEWEQITRSPTLKSALRATNSLLTAKLRAIEKALTSSELTCSPGYNDPIYDQVKDQ